MSLFPFDNDLKESLALMREVVKELKEIKELLKNEQQWHQTHWNWHVGDGR